MAADRDARAVPADEADGHWHVDEGTPTRSPGPDPYRADGTERLTYNNPYHLELERVWFDGKVVYACEMGEVDLPFDADRNAIGNKVAQEYQCVYAVELDARGKTVSDPEHVEGQFNIYDSVPGMEQYSPLWQFNYVVVPRDYVPQTLRSEKDCLESGYPVLRSTVVEN